MSISGKNVRQMLNEAKSGRVFKTEFRKLLGIHVDPITGQKSIKNPEIDPSEFSIREMTEHFLGHEFVSELHLGPMSDTRSQMMRKSINESMAFEDAVGGLPSAMSDINAWNAGIAGLVERRLLDGWTRPEFIWRDFVEFRPTFVNGGKFTLVPPMGDVAMKIVPGQEFPTILPTILPTQFYVWAQPNKIWGVKTAVDRDTIVYDLTGEAMGGFESIGASLGYRQEVLVATGVQGIINSYVAMQEAYTGSANATYQTTAGASPYNYKNKQSLALTDYTSLQAAQNLLNLMRDPVMNLPIDVDIKTVLVDPSGKWTASTIQRETWVRNQTSPNAGNFPTVVVEAPNPLPQFEVKYSNIWHKVLVDSGISESDAEQYWFAGDFKKAFAWASAWDLRTDNVNPTSSEMLTRNLVAAWVSQFSGQFVVKMPQYAIESTN